MVLPPGTTWWGRLRPAERRLLAVTLLTLAVGALLLLGPEPLFGPARRSDIWRLFDERGIRPHHPPFVDRPLEYPVLLGLMMWAVSWVAASPTATLLVTGVAAGGAALLVTHMLFTRCASRALMWAASPTLGLYAFHNWDLFAVAPAIGGVLVYGRGSYELAGLLLGLGTATKWYPALYLLVLAAHRWSVGDRRGIWRLAWPAVAVNLGLNLPVLLADPPGWAYAYDFHRGRLPTRETLWHFVIRDRGFDLWLDPANAVRLVNLGAGVVVVAGTLLVVTRVLRGRTTPVAACAAATVVFLLGSKVYSAQYDLWLLAFLPLLGVTWRRWWALSVLDVVLFVVLFEIRDDSLRDHRLAVILVNDILRFAWLGSFALRCLWPRNPEGVDRDEPAAPSPEPALASA